MTYVPQATVIYNHTKNTIEFDLPSYPPTETPSEVICNAHNRKTRGFVNSYRKKSHNTP